MRPSALSSCHPLWNANRKKEGVSPISADLTPKIGCHGKIPSAMVKQIPDQTSTATQNLVKMSLVGSEISL